MPPRIQTEILSTWIKTVIDHLGDLEVQVDVAGGVGQAINEKVAAMII